MFKNGARIDMDFFAEDLTHAEKVFFAKDASDNRVLLLFFLQTK
jgi:hypothetical protein